MAELIPWIQRATVYIISIVLGLHNVYKLLRVVGSEKLGMPMCTPFDSKPSPIYEITLIIQVMQTILNKFYSLTLPPW